MSAFKELLASTKALLAEYSNRPRTVATYQSGDIGRLTNIERFATAYQAVANHLSNNAERLQVAQERDRARFEALAAEERSKQGWIDLALGAVTIAVGLAAIVATAGAATPLVVGAGIVAGTGTVAYGASNVAEAGQDIYLGYKGDGKTLAINPIRDTLFMGNDKLYHQVGGLFTTTSAVMIPIGQTQSVTKGLAEFAIGEVGGFVGGQAGYYGTKLLGGSEVDAERATFVGSILGGFAASSVASKFSLNKLNTKTPNEIPNSTSTPPLDVLDEPVKVNTFDSWDDMKNAHKGTVTKFVQDNKPKGSPVVRDWFNKKSGTLTIEEFADGSQVWKYTNSDGVTVPYSKQVINGKSVGVPDFFEYLYGNKNIADINIGKFTGDRGKDLAKFLQQTGLDEIPEGYVLHHGYVNGQLQLIDLRVHSSFSHIGGHSIFMP